MQADRLAGIGRVAIAHCLTPSQLSIDSGRTGGGLRLNDGHEFSYGRDELVQMLDDALAPAQRSPVGDSPTDTIHEVARLRGALAPGGNSPR